MITRRFDAPRELLFDAMTKPPLLTRWLSGPPGWSLAVCEVDLVVGGEALSTLVLTELGGTTTLTSTMTYASREARDAVLRTPMKQGMAIGYDRLAVLIATSGSNS